MKFTWGHGVTIAFTLFVVYILSFVYRSFYNEVDLVAEDYYVQEVAYQDRIDETENARDVAINVQRTDSGLVIVFPKDQPIDNESGVLYFFRPSDETLDIKLPLMLDENGTQIVPVQVLKTGRYKLNISWNSQDKGYYVSKDVVI